MFFGGLLLLAALGTILMDARKTCRDRIAQRFAAVTSNMPFVADRAAAQPHHVARNRLDAAPIGMAVFVLVFFLHPWISGGAQAQP